MCCFLVSPSTPNCYGLITSISLYAESSVCLSPDNGYVGASNNRWVIYCELAFPWLKGIWQSWGTFIPHLLSIGQSQLADWKTLRAFQKSMLDLYLIFLLYVYSALYGYVKKIWSPLTLHYQAMPWDKGLNCKITLWLGKVSTWYASAKAQT